MITANARAQEISIDLILDQQLTQAQSLSLPSLGLIMNRRGQRMMNLILHNTTQRRQENLYLQFEVSAARLGVISTLTHDQPFSLNAGQRIITDNMQLREGLPGVKEQLTFDAGMTEAGDRLMQSLDGSIRLPNDIYQITAEIYQQLDGRRRLIGRVADQMGTSVGGDAMNLSLLNPGGPPGSNIPAHSFQPVFRWNGRHGERYRIIVVQDDGQSPETLIQSALSTEPPPEFGGAGSFLDFEMADALIDQSSFNYPFSGVQPLEAGIKYYWQVFTLIETGNGTEELPSEIWEFSVTGPGNTTGVPLSEDLIVFLQIILGDDYQQLRDDGFSLGSMVLDGRQYSGSALIRKLEELRQLNENGDITILGN
ncbi:MAG: hypothetical protein WD266_02755 [Balneolales bacterium]